MTRDETKKILALICTIFPKAFERAGAEATRNAWAVMFEEEYYAVVLQAVKKVLRTSKFAPTVAEVSAEIEQIKQEMRAKLKQYDYYFAPLPEKCRECTAYKEFIDRLRKCGACKCPYDITEEERNKYALSDEQINSMKAILQGTKHKNDTFLLEG